MLCHPVGQHFRPGMWDNSVLADDLDDLEDANTASTTVSEPQIEHIGILEHIVVERCEQGIPVVNRFKT